MRGLGQVTCTHWRTLVYYYLYFQCYFVFSFLELPLTLYLLLHRLCFVSTSSNRENGLSSDTDELYGLCCCLDVLSILVTCNNHISSISARIFRYGILQNRFFSGRNFILKLENSSRNYDLQPRIRKWLFFSIWFR